MRRAFRGLALTVLAFGIGWVLANFTDGWVHVGSVLADRLNLQDNSLETAVRVALRVLQIALAIGVFILTFLVTASILAQDGAGDSHGSRRSAGLVVVLYGAYLVFLYLLELAGVPVRISGDSPLWLKWSHGAIPGLIFVLGWWIYLLPGPKRKRRKA
jgi:hypothetical protein